MTDPVVLVASLSPALITCTQSPSTQALATYMQHYNDDINYFKPQPYLCTGPLSKGMELIMQLRAGILPLNAMTAEFGRQSASRQSARRECCKSCDLGPELGGEVESPEHFLFDCPVYQAQRQKLWEKLTSDPDVAAKCQILDGKSDEEKLHSMLNEEFWGVDVDEESGLVYGPFKHAFTNYQLPNGPVKAGRRWGQRHPQGANLGSNGRLKFLSKLKQSAATSPP